ncbi:MAG: RNA 2',3'-cyclic phosphodiesterase [Deltaproteobacteria bacterium]|nr:RNA 2',3'-cyclic phosphodiesterase [Deltaproteobacteria bacterium]
MIRCFLAIDLPEDLRPQLALVQGELKKSQADVRWVPPGNIHITLKFFGNVTDAEIPNIVAAAREVAMGQAPLTLKVTGAGAFPSVRSPRVVWLGLGGDMLPLAQLYQRLEKAFAALDYPPETRAFNPHLTLGRVRSPEGRAQLSRAIEKLVVDWPPFPVREIILFQSVLSPKGSTYTPLEVIKLSER